MQKKRFKQKIIIPIVFLIFLILIINIGIVFASEDSFSINGMEIIEKSETTEVNNFSYDKCKIKSDVTFHKLGDSITYKIKIVNNDDMDYIIKSIRNDNNNEFISCTIKDNYKDTKVSAGGEVLIEVTEKYVQENTDISNRNQDFSINLTFTLENENGEIVEKTIVLNNNPHTGDNIGISIVIFIVAAIVLICISGRRNNKRYLKSSYKLISIFIIGIILTPVISKAVTDYAVALDFQNTISLKDKVTFTYIINNESFVKTIGYNETITDLVDPEIPGYIFEGWKNEDGTDFDKSLPINDDVSVIAKLVPIKYSIKYVLNDSILEEGKTNPIEYTVESEDIILNNPVKDGYTFIGWTGTDLTEETTDVVISKSSIGDREYTANFEINSYVVKFDSKGGSNVSDITRNYNEEIGELPTSVKENQVFEGWYTDENYMNRVDSNTKVTNSITYIAKWRDLYKYQINYDTDGGNEISSVYVTEGDSLGLLPVPEKENYKFRGWYTNKDYTTRVDESTVPAGNSTYYAKWVDKLSTVFSIDNSVTFNGKDGVIPDGEVPEEYIGSDGKYIDTNISLFSEENFDKDFEVGFTIESYNPNNQDPSSNNQYVFVNTKDEDGTTNIRPGFVFRVKSGNKSCLELGVATNVSDNKNFNDCNSVYNVKIYRIDKKIYYSINDGEKILVSSRFVNYDNRFNATTTFGAAVQQNGTVFRHLNATLSNMYVKLENNDEF